MDCSNFNNCVSQKMAQLSYPEDKKSLYAERIYDLETANRRCYEGFGFPSDMSTIFKWIVLILVVYLGIMLLMKLFKPVEEVVLDIESATVPIFTEKGFIKSE